MDKLIDKLLILMIALTLYIPSVDHIYMVIPILIAVLLSALLSYFEDHRIILSIYFSFILICFFESSFLFFIPLICYDILIFKIKWIWAFALIPLVANSNEILSLNKVLIVVFLLLVYLLKYRTISLQSMKKEYYELQYNANEALMQLEKKNKALMEKQDYEISLATLNERNRIARDIHDNVGHMLSRSILQVGALLTICKDENINQMLTSIKDTLTEAMDSIRSSVHNLHDQSINLKTEVQKLIDNMEGYTISFDYDVKTSPDKELKYCFISVVKEALANIIKHSNATKVSIVIREHPGLYQLVIQDNGTLVSYRNEDQIQEKTSYAIKKGIGLKNIEDRVTALNGNINISFNKGFRIFISIPKK